MNIQQAAVKIISQWEHVGGYDCHGNGAYGLIGFQGDWLTTLLVRYIQKGGELEHAPDWYASELMEDSAHFNEELDHVSKLILMEKVQKEVALEYMTKAIKWQWRYYPFKSALAQLICCDIGVNSGINNWYVKHSGRHLLDSETVAINKVMVYRRQALADYGIWQKFPGIRRRWQWYMDLITGGSDLTLNSILPQTDVNGNIVEFGSHQIQPLDTGVIGWNRK